MKPLNKQTEKYVKDQIKKLLIKYGAYYHMPVQQGYGSPSLDFIGCHHGRFFGIEAKRPGKKPTARQELTMAMINDAEGAVFVIGDDCIYEPGDMGDPPVAVAFTGMEALEGWLLLAP